LTRGHGQLPGTLDLVSLDGVRASATFKAEAPWRGHLLFLRRDLVTGNAGGRRIMQDTWGEHEVTVDWNAVPPGSMRYAKPTRTYGATFGSSMSLISYGHGSSSCGAMRLPGDGPDEPVRLQMEPPARRNVNLSGGSGYVG
jgi:hypothetical protein